jgi:phosphatidylserine/phosphatidylglycerophosphate/cardiolipin synthase-like enzyme
LAPNSELWNILQDLRDAGVPEMVNETIGWRLEVANFEGAWPHSHAKMVVVDGKTAAAVGFNMRYDHFPPEHPSGLGEGKVDTAVQMTGPVAQDARRAFDELWAGAVRRHCANFFPFHRQWQLTCRDSRASADHVPEVMRYYLPRGSATAFSMLRTHVHDEADEQIVAALAAAEKSIDIMHIQFSLALACNLEYLFEVCSTTQVPAYIDSLLEAIETKDVQARLLIDLEPIKGIESLLAVRGLQRLVDKRGMGDRVEIRAFPGPVHVKNTLIDDELLIVGSQNFHWSAFGQGRGLAEYNLGVSDPEAIEDFKRRFQYYWDLASTGPGLSDQTSD